MFNTNKQVIDFSFDQQMKCEFIPPSIPIQNDGCKDFATLPNQLCFGVMPLPWAPCHIS